MPAIVYFGFLCRNFSSDHTPAATSTSTKADTRTLSDGWSAASEDIVEEVPKDVLEEAMEVVEEAREEVVP